MLSKKEGEENLQGRFNIENKKYGGVSIRDVRNYRLNTETWVRAHYNPNLPEGSAPVPKSDFTLVDLYQVNYKGYGSALAFLEDAIGTIAGIEES